MLSGGFVTFKQLMDYKNPHGYSKVPSTWHISQRELFHLFLVWLFVSLYVPLTCGVKWGVNPLQFKELLQADIEKQTFLPLVFYLCYRPFLAQSAVVEFAPVSCISCLFDSADFKLICHLRDPASPPKSKYFESYTRFWQENTTPIYLRFSARMFRVALNSQCYSSLISVRSYINNVK